MTDRGTGNDRDFSLVLRNGAHVVKSQYSRDSRGAFLKGRSIIFERAGRLYLAALLANCLNEDARLFPALGHDASHIALQEANSMFEKGVVA